VGGALLVRTVALIATMALATAVAARIGAVAVAAHQVASQLWLLLALVVDALAVAAQALLAGSPPDEARRLSNRLLGWGLALGLLLGAVFAALRPWLPLLFTDDPAAVARVDTLLPFVIWMQPLNALVFVWDGIFMGARDFRYLAGQMVLSAMVAATVLLLVVPMGWGLAGVWWGIVALMGTRALTLGARYLRATGPPRG
jgi:MATE family multidrug resistance protein